MHKNILIEVKVRGAETQSCNFIITDLYSAILYDDIRNRKFNYINKCGLAEMYDNLFLFKNGLLQSSNMSILTLDGISDCFSYIVRDIQDSSIISELSHLTFGDKKLTCYNLYIALGLSMKSIEDLLLMTAYFNLKINDTFDILQPHISNILTFDDVKKIFDTKLEYIKSLANGEIEMQHIKPDRLTIKH